MKTKELKGAEAFGIIMEEYNESVVDMKKILASDSMKIANEVARNLIIIDDSEELERYKKANNM